MLPSIDLNSAAFRRYAFRFFIRPFLLTIAMCCFALFVWHIRLGSSSPGLLALAGLNLPYWGSVFFILFFVLPCAAALFFIAKTTRKARPYGIPWYEYLDLPREEREKLEGEIGKT
jgi:hypothetical protein